MEWENKMRKGSPQFAIFFKKRTNWFFHFQQNNKPHGMIK